MQGFKTKDLTLMGILSSLIIIMTFVPYTGYISYGIFSITTIHIPVIIGAVVLGKKGGFVLGLVWGVSNIVKAYTLMTPEAIIFLDPRISILPRIAAGFFAGFLGDLLQDKNIRSNPIMCLVGVTATLFHTALVLTAISLWGGDNIFNLGENIMTIFKVVFSINGTVELVLAGILVPIVVNALRAAGFIKRKAERC
ncbi:MAG: ECF transporter S component [Lachnospirales bacterium]